MSLIKTNKNKDFFPSLFSDFFDNERFPNNPWLRHEFSQVPAVNIKNADHSYEIDLAVPGFKKDDFKITVDDNVLTISVDKKEEKNEENERFTRKEFSYSSFSRSFTLPQNSDEDNIDAKYNDGILKLSIPKKAEAKALPKKEIRIG